MAEINSTTIGNTDSELNETDLLSDANLVAYWRMEGNSTDETANNHDGTDTSITYSTGNGKYTQGAGFNGTTSKITTPDANDLDLTGNFTICAWINTNTAAATSSIVEKYVSGNGYYFRLNSSGKVVIAVQKNGGASSASLAGLTTVPTNEWIHVAGTYDGTFLRVYLNGVADNIVACAFSNSASAATLKIGARGDTGTTNYFNGEIDDVAVFDRVLLTSEIRTLCDQNRKAYYRFESGALTTDSSGNSNTLTNVNTATEATGKYGGAVDLELSSSQYLYAADSASLSIVGDISIDAWVKIEQLPSTAASSFYLVTKYGTNTHKSFYFTITNEDKLRFFYTSDGANAAYSFFTADSATFTSADVGRWVHIAITVDVSAKTAVIYKNGSSVANTRTDGGGGATSIFDSDNALYIGATTDTGSANSFFDGLMDDVCVFSRVLTAAEILQLYKDGADKFFLMF